MLRKHCQYFLSNHVPNHENCQKIIMERSYSNLSLPQGVLRPAKRSLVRSTQSDGEIKFQAYNCFDEQCQPKKIRLNKACHQLDKHSLEKRAVTPSTEDDTQQNFNGVSSQDDLWTSIQSNYKFLMAEDLIQECKETRQELHLLGLPEIPSYSSSLTSSQHIYTFEEFKEKFNHLHDTLHSIQKSSTQETINEFRVKELYHDYHQLKEQSEILKLMNPDLIDYISKRVNILSNKWDILDRVLHPEKAKECDEIIRNLSNQMKVLRKWLREVEDKLRNHKVSSENDARKINEIFGEQKNLQQEIESRGQELTSIVRQCVSIEGATAADSKRLRRAATHLERSWHNIWLRSLEKQCLTEQHLLQYQNNENKSPESSDVDTDEGPINKHRRLTLDHWTAVKNRKMDTNLPDRKYKTNELLQKSPTRDIGVLCSNIVPVNDKCIMVGTTGIAALKAEYGDDFTNFEIIQDVGYSSESSTHLSSDDGIGVGGDRYFNIRVYKYLDNAAVKTNISLKEEIENACAKQQFPSLSSSVDSSSGRTSFNDSGIGNNESPAVEDTFDVLKEQSPVDEQLEYRCEKDSVEEEQPGEESDFLETVLASCTSFNNDNAKSHQSDSNDVDDLPFSLSDLDSDDAGCNFHDRTSFTKPAQVFYKMISVDSDNCDNEQPGKESTNTSVQVDNFKPVITETHNQSSTTTDRNSTFAESNQEPPISKRRHSKMRTSTPLRKSYKRDKFPSHHQNLKRKRDCDNERNCNLFIIEPIGLSKNEVVSWIQQATKYREEHYPSGDCYTHSPEAKGFYPFDDVSSCDASGEYTSSSADEGHNVSASFNPEETFYSKESHDSQSMEGSVETVIRNLSASFDTQCFSPSASFTKLTSSSPFNSDNQNYKENDRHLNMLSSKNFPLMSEKSFSDGDLRTFYRNHMLEKQKSWKLSPGCRQQLSNSLPCVLSTWSGSSTEDTTDPAIFCASKRHRSRKSCQSVSLNASSSSEFGKHKRRRKKSSSSARSSKSALHSSDSGRNRSKTLIQALNESPGKRRHFSQQSAFFESSENIFFSEDDGSFSEVKISGDDLVRKNLNVDLVRSLDDSCNDGVNSEFLSPVESDVVLTRLEEQSTVSDQVWDSYQEMPYLSEGYSEATIDEDALRKLTEFGDDYGSALRFIDASDSKIIHKESSKSPKKSSKTSLNHTQRSIFSSNDSDSDTEDLHHVIEEARKALHFARATVKKGLSDDFFTSAEYVELLATCGTHLRCLQTICEHIENDENVNNFSLNDLEELHRLIKEWEFLRHSLEMMNEEEDYVKHKFVKAKQKIDNLFNTMAELSSLSEVELERFTSWENLKEKIAQLQSVMTTLQSTKEQLLAVNLEVHRFMTDHGTDMDYKNCALKENITELYQKWDDIYETNGRQLTALEIIFKTWETYDDKLSDLRICLKLIENDCDNVNCDLDKEEIAENLFDLQKNAALLKEFLKGGAICKNIDLELEDLAERINKYTRTHLTSRRIENVQPQDQSEDTLDHVAQLLDTRKDSQSQHKLITDGLTKDDTTSTKRKSSRFWRMIRIAVPVQLALVMLYCIACVLEPNCCDMLNNFSLSLTPHLRYWRGPPPA